MAPDGGTGGGTELFSFVLCGISEFIRFLLGLLSVSPCKTLVSPMFCKADSSNELRVLRDSACKIPNIDLAGDGG